MDERRARFEALYHANYDRVRGYARRRTGSIDNALDVVADTFLTAWRRLDDVPAGDRGRLWLYGSSRRTLANHHRGQRRHQNQTARLERQPRSPSEDPAATALGGDEAERIAAAFERLSVDGRELLLLTAWEGLDALETAHVLGCTRPTVRVRLHRARRRLADGSRSTGEAVTGLRRFRLGALEAEIDQPMLGLWAACEGQELRRRIEYLQATMSGSSTLLPLIEQDGADGHSASATSPTWPMPSTTGSITRYALATHLDAGCGAQDRDTRIRNRPGFGKEWPAPGLVESGFWTLMLQVRGACRGFGVG